MQGYQSLQQPIQREQPVQQPVQSQPDQYQLATRPGRQSSQLALPSVQGQDQPTGIPVRQQQPQWAVSPSDTRHQPQPVSGQPSLVQPAVLQQQPMPQQPVQSQPQSGQLQVQPQLTPFSQGMESVQQPTALDPQADRPSAAIQPEPATSPLVDIYDSADEITIVADLPGSGPDNVHLEASNKTLRITAERRSDAEEEAEGRRTVHRERLGRSERVIALPADVDVEEAEASFENGVCTVTLPKAETERQKRIGVQ